MTEAVRQDKASAELVAGGAKRVTIVDRVAGLALVDRDWYDVVIVTEDVKGGTFVQNGAADNGDISVNGFTNILSLGTVMMAGLPTANPLVAGQVWSNAGVLTVSAG